MRALCRRAAGQRQLLLRDGSVALAQSFSSGAADDEPPGPSGRGRGRIVLPPPAPVQPAAPGQRRAQPAAAQPSQQASPGRGVEPEAPGQPARQARPSAGVGAQAPGTPHSAPPARGAGRGQAFIVPPTPAAPPPRAGATSRSPAAALPRDDRRAPRPLPDRRFGERGERGEVAQPGLRRGPPDARRDLGGRRAGPLGAQERFARPQQQRGGAAGGGVRPSSRQDAGGYGARAADRGGPRPARGGDGGSFSGMGAELSAMSSWDARRSGGGGAGDAADRDRFLSAEELEERERKEKQWRSRQYTPKPRGGGGARGRGGPAARGGRGGGRGGFGGARPSAASGSEDDEERPRWRRDDDDEDDEPTRRPKKELPWELNPYRDPTQAETSDEENTDEEEEDEEREGRAREPGRGMLDAEEDYAEPLQHDFFDPVEDRALREQVQAGILAQEEQYPPGPAELEAADPETMPSELEAIDALQRVFKMELDPHMQMDFGPAPQNYWGPPPLRPGEEQGGAPADDAAELTPAQLLEGLRPELERRLNLEPGDDETWADITDGAAEGVEQFAFLRAPDVWGEEAQLRAMLADNVPQGHELRPHLEAALEMALANASWPHAVKHRFLVQLLGSACGVKLPHLGQRRAARA